MSAKLSRGSSMWENIVSLHALVSKSMEIPLEVFKLILKYIP